MSVQEFLSTVYTKTYRLFPGPPERVGRLLSLPQLKGILRRPGFDPGRVLLVLQGREIDRRRFCTDAGGGPQLSPPLVQGLLSSGAALVVSQVQNQHRPVWQLTNALQTVLRTGVSANVYAGEAGSRGFDLHVDHHDVLIVQVSGEKRWFIGPRSSAWPLQVPAHNGERPDELLWSGVLSQGDVLYLPRGYWHRAEATDDGPSLHLSCGIQPCTGVHILHRLKDLLMDDPLFRTELPRFAPAAEFQAHIGALVENLTSRWGEGLAEDFVSFYEERVRREAAATDERLWGEKT